MLFLQDTISLQLTILSSIINSFILHSGRTAVYIFLWLEWKCSCIRTNFLRYLKQTHFLLLNAKLQCTSVLNLQKEEQISNDLHWKIWSGTVLNLLIHEVTLHKNTLLSNCITNYTVFRKSVLGITASFSTISIWKFSSSHKYLASDVHVMLKTWGAALSIALPDFNQNCSM